MDIQSRFRLNRVALDIQTIEHLLAINKINKRDALRNLNHAFDALIDIRHDCPDEDVESYVARAWGHIERLTMK